MGRRKFLYNILNPICDENYLLREYDITDYILKNFEKFNQNFNSKLIHIKDLAKFERQIFLKKISPKSIYTLDTSVKKIVEIFDIIKDDNVILDYLKNFDKNVMEIGNVCNELITFINENIDLNLGKDIDQLQQFEINFIKQGVDCDLDKKTETLKDSELGLEAIKDYLSNLIENKEKKTSKTNDFVKIHETEKNNYSLICTSRRCKILQDALPIIETDITLNISSNKPFIFNVSKTRFTFEKQSSSNNSIIDSQISKFCKNISSIKISMKDLITLIYNRFIEKLGINFQNNLEKIINFITIIDIIYTKSSIAKNFNYCKPEIMDYEKSFVNAKGLRHCLIEQFQTNELYISNDISLGDGKTDGVLLYGTNAVGKTTLIRALGISVIMAQAGLYVPASSFKYKPYKYIFTRILGNDNIFKGLSTFAVEMSELRTILRLANENSLVLGDELCSGTESISAVSIFVAGVQSLSNINCSFIFATHLHEIIGYDEITSLHNVGMKHMSVL
jgi:DNA mismatch repair protein MutS